MQRGKRFWGPGALVVLSGAAFGARETPEPKLLGARRGVVGQSMAAGFCALNGGCIAALAWELYGFTGFLFLEGVCVNVNFSFFC